MKIAMNLLCVMVVFFSHKDNGNWRKLFIFALSVPRTKDRHYKSEHRGTSSPQSELGISCLARFVFYRARDGARI